MKSIDIVYVLGKGSTHGNLELKYSIQTVLKYANGFRNIYVIGESPGFDGTFTHIYYPDCGINKQDNIRRKIEFACTQQGLSNRFLFMNDDHFFNQPVDVTRYPYYYQGSVSEKVAARRIQDEYKSALRNTDEVLPGAKHFDIHTPIIYDKKKFPHVMSLYNWPKPFVIKSLYCGALGKRGEPYSECNINKCYPTAQSIREQIGDRHTWSVGPGGLNDTLAAMLRFELSEMIENSVNLK